MSARRWHPWHPLTVACEAELLAGWDERTTSVRPEEDAGECEFFGYAWPSLDLVIETSMCAGG